MCLLYSAVIQSIGLTREENPGVDFVDDDAGSPPPSSSGMRRYKKIILDPINTDQMKVYIKRIAPVMHIKIVYIYIWSKNALLYIDSPNFQTIVKKDSEQWRNPTINPSEYPSHSHPIDRHSSSPYKQPSQYQTSHIAHPSTYHTCTGR